ncbi:ADP,ATP carrier protein, mitochondrial [Capsicum baccatum]|uniref:ADP/ATP translocase n=1 Tax=Capsicum baccatum TaxID=33114 RepID=A0A2G2V1C9_CAPBA|nr:ADP,ATP carrier protein, mitochondrial [Capsicum baccatum]
MITAYASPVFVQAPAEKGIEAFATDFLMGGVSAGFSKTDSAPIKRVKLMKDRDGYWKCFSGNLASGGAAGASSLFYVYSLDYARTHIENDAKAAKKGGERQFNACGDKSIKSSGDNLSMITANASPVFVKAPTEKGVAAFVTDFLMGGVSADVSKTAAAPIERVKLLIKTKMR